MKIFLYICDMMKLRLLLFFLIFNVADKMQAADVVWYNGKTPVSYNVQNRVSPVVEVALDMFCEDMRLVTGHRADRKGNASIDIVQLDMLSNKEFKKLNKRNLPINRIISKKEAFYIGCHGGKLVVIGSDARGTAYGILELSRMAGVSPWVWWGDVIPEKKTELRIADNFVTVQWPSVEYRGVFINDEDWSLRIWAHECMDRELSDGIIGPRTYKKIFELLLRLRANTLWPAMHEGTTPFFQVKGNREVADSCAIIIGSSHCEPLLRNNVGEWNRTRMGDYNFLTNRQNVLDYWGERVHETRNMEVIYTLGMRGIHDGSMEGVNTMGEKTRALQMVIDEQRKLLRKYRNDNLDNVPQVFVPYKEVLDIFENGLQVPDDVMLMWCDDNYGFMTRLPDEVQQRRNGGNGIYYHLSYWGRPHDYLWLSTTQPGLLAHELRTAFDHKARRLWIANIHDPKVAAYDLSLFLDMAWNINSVNPNKVSLHLAKWLQSQFGHEVGSELFPVMRNFYWLTALRKPEFMGWNQVELDKKKFQRGLSPVHDTEFSAIAFGNELERYLDNYEQTKKMVTEVEKHLRPDLQDAFFAAVKYPVFAAAAMAVKQLESQEARHIARPESFHHDEEALVSAARSIVAAKEIKLLTDYYNHQLSQGKWRGLMCENPRQLPVFGPLELPGQLSEEEVGNFSRQELISEQLTAMQEAQRAVRQQRLPPGVIAKNACDFTAATDGVVPVEMLGHSMKAVSIPKDGSVSYRFSMSKHGEGLLRIAMIPTHACDKDDIRFSVSIDGASPQVFSLKEPFRSERWKEQVLRGQAVRMMKVFLTWGTHTLTIKALDNHIIFDQWMFDIDKTREFYSFPLEPAL